MRFRCIGKFGSVLLSGTVSLGWVLCSAPQSALGELPGQDVLMEASRAEHYRRDVKDWVPAFEWDFTSGEWPEGMGVVQGEWEIGEGELRVVGGEPASNRLLIVGPQVHRNFSLEFTVRMEPWEDGRMGDLIIRLNGLPETGSFVRGYAVILGHFMNQATTVYRLNIPVARTEHSFLQPGKSHRIRLDVIETTRRNQPTVHLRCWVDGQVALDYWDRNQGLVMDPERVLALSTYGNRMTISGMRLLLPPE